MGSQQVKEEKKEVVNINNNNNGKQDTQLVLTSILLAAFVFTLFAVVTVLAYKKCKRTLEYKVRREAREEASNQWKKSTRNEAQKV